MGKLGLVLFTLSISILIFCAFIFGVTVGVNIESYPENIAKSIPYMIKQKISRGSTSETAGSPASELKEEKPTADEKAGKEDLKLTFFDTLTKGREEKKETSTEPTIRKFTIQLASLQDRKKAEDLKEKLTKQGYHPVLDVVELTDRGKWYRVNLLGFESREDARKAAAEIEKNVKGIQCLIVPSGN